MLPLGKSLDIGQAGNWRVEWAGIRSPTEADKAAYGLNRRWLYPFDIPVIIEAPAIAIRCSMANAPATWKTAGYLLRTTPFPLDLQTLEDDAPGLSPAVTDRRLLRLNAEFEILLFNQSSAELRLTMIPQPWLPSLGLTIYSYSGPVGDDVLEQLAAIRAKLEIIDAQVG